MTYGMKADFKAPSEAELIKMDKVVLEFDDYIKTILTKEADLLRSRFGYIHVDSKGDMLRITSEIGLTSLITNDMFMDIAESLEVGNIELASELLKTHFNSYGVRFDMVELLDEVSSETRGTISQDVLNFINTFTY